MVIQTLAAKIYRALAPEPVLSTNLIRFLTNKADHSHPIASTAVQCFEEGIIYRMTTRKLL